MSTKNQNDRTFIEKARRAQIIEHAIALIAEVGYGQTSIGQIAKRASISKGVISYHFSGKEELMIEVMREVMQTFTAFVIVRIGTETSPSGILRAFIKANVEFIQHHCEALLALLEIVQSARTESGKPVFNGGVIETDLKSLEQVLLQGQQQGEFRAFDVQIMAAAILSIRNGALAQIAADPNLDYTRYADELVTLVDQATRNDGTRKTD